MHADGTFGLGPRAGERVAQDGMPAKHDKFSFSVTCDRSPTRSLPYRFREYEVLRKIGEGGMGEVYLASMFKEKTRREELAIKFLHSHRGTCDQDRARFMREMQISVELKHPSIIDCIDCGEEDEQPFIVMPYCAGGNLAELLKRAGKLNLRRALRLLDRLLAGMEQAHATGIVHRDLKPCNVLLARDSNRKYVPKISDFGLAKSYLLAGDSGMTVNGTVGGSWGYMPKEQLTNFRFVSPQSDVWSLGAILYECLTLKLPRPLQPGIDPIRVVLDSKLIPIQKVLPDIPNSIARFVMKSLSVDIADRFKDAQQMRAALHTAASVEGVEL
jgi:serine/threonine protein kinase